MAYFVYNLLLAILSPLLFPYALARSWFRGIRGERLWERLGRLPASFQQTGRQTRRDAIWLHAVSVGETTSAQSLLGRLRASLPGVPVYLSTTTPEGRRVAEEKLSSLIDGVFYLPLDIPYTLRRAFATIRPRLVIVSETEIWPNFFRLAKRHGARLMIVNGRMSDRSSPRYASLRWFFGTVLQDVDRILVQSEQDRERFLAAGAPETNVAVGGNLKYDFTANDATLPDDLAHFLDQLDAGPILVAGSTREAEEGPVVKAFREIARKHPRALLVVAPRHPSRFAEVAEVVQAGGLPLVRRSELNGEQPTATCLPSVLLLDTVGELASLYSRADLVFVGGSLNGWGGHNVLEPSLQGRPVIVGPHMQNFREVAERMLRDRAIVQVKNADQLAGAFEQVLSDPGKARELGARGRDAALPYRGAAKRAAAEAVKLYRSGPPAAPMGTLKTAALYLPAALWRAGADVHRAVYEKGYRGRRRLDTFTVCVGNITVGGTGKTPTVMWLVEKLHAAGVRPAVLTRGYHRADPEPQTVVAAGATVSPFVGGDEAQLMLRRFARLKIPVSLGIGADRYRVGRRIEDAARGENTRKPEAFTLDDGFQHFRLHRDFDLVLIDADDPFGGEEMLPLGRLREPLSGLRRASAFLLTRTQPDHDYSAVEARLRQWNSAAPIYRSRIETAGLREVRGTGEVLMRNLAGRRVLAFAGLGNPEAFFRSLEDSGAELVERMRFRDHHHYTAADVEAISEAAWSGKAQLVVTTEKDLVNLCHAVEKTVVEKEGVEAAAAHLFGAVPLAWLAIEIVVENGDELVDRIVEAVRARESA